MADRRPDAGNLVGDHRNAEAGFAQEYPPVEPPACDGRSHLEPDGGIITRLWGMRSKVCDLTPPTLQNLNETSLQGEPPVIGSEGDAEPSRGNAGIPCGT